MSGIDPHWSFAISESSNSFNGAEVQLLSMGKANHSAVISILRTVLCCLMSDTHAVTKIPLLNSMLIEVLNIDILFMVSSPLILLLDFFSAKSSLIKICLPANQHVITICPQTINSS